MSKVLSAVLPGTSPVGEAWVLSDRDDHASVIAHGPLKGITLSHLVRTRPERLLGRRTERFPLLLKFLDVRAALSVQVHPSDQQPQYLPAGESGKTEAWVVLAVGDEGRVFAGLTPNTTTELLRQSLLTGSVTAHLASFTPMLGDGVFIPAGTVHSLRDLVVFEVQQNSDVTFRLYDWNHIDANTHQPRSLQIEQAVACIDFKQGAITPVVPLVEQVEPTYREKLFACEYFRLWRLRSESPFSVGAKGVARILVCIGGEGEVTHKGAAFRLGMGDVMLLPAEVGVCLCQPRGFLNVLEIALPQGTCKK